MLTACRSACRFASSRVLVLLAIFATTSFAVHAEDIKVAFIGDQGVGRSARSVLELIRDEGTELLLIQGDLGYDPDTANAWIANIDTILGKEFPVLIVVGNHENHEWPKYLAWQKDKLARVNDIRCEGDISVKAYCTYKTIGVVQVAPAIDEVEGIDGLDDYASYITDKLSNDDSTWRVCSWHKNMRDMQAGGKGDSTGWGVYQNCLAEGGLVLTGHEHSYSRTYLMSSFEDKTVIHTGDDMDIGPDSSVAIVSGLGGRETRAQQHGGDWFASIYTATQDANPGSLFCTFNGDKANCYFKDVAGLVPDTFKLRSKLKPSDDSGSEGPTEQEPELEPEPEQEPVVEQEPETQPVPAEQQPAEEDSEQQIPDDTDTTDSAEGDDSQTSEPADAGDQSQDDPEPPGEDSAEQNQAGQEIFDQTSNAEAQITVDSAVEPGINEQVGPPNAYIVDELSDVNPFDAVPTSIVDDGTTPLADSAPPPPLTQSATTGAGSMGWLMILALGVAPMLRQRSLANNMQHE